MGAFPDIFPENFCENILPTKAVFQDVPKMYRIIKTGKINRDSFISTAEETHRGFRPFNKATDNVECYDYYSTSLFGNAEYIKQIAESFRVHNPKAIIAIGEIKASCGPSISDEKLKEKKDPKQHYHWWIYKDATPEKYFAKEETTDVKLK